MKLMTVLKFLLFLFYKFPFRMHEKIRCQICERYWTSYICISSSYQKKVINRKQKFKLPFLLLLKQINIKLEFSTFVELQDKLISLYVRSQMFCIQNLYIYMHTCMWFCHSPCGLVVYKY